MTRVHIPTSNFAVSPLGKKSPRHTMLLSHLLASSFGFSFTSKPLLKRRKLPPATTPSKKSSPGLSNSTVASTSSRERPFSLPYSVHSKLRIPLPPIPPPPPPPPPPAQPSFSFSTPCVSNFLLPASLISSLIRESFPSHSVMPPLHVARAERANFPNRQSYVVNEQPHFQMLLSRGSLEFRVLSHAYVPLIDGSYSWSHFMVMQLVEA